MYKKIFFISLLSLLLINNQLLATNTNTHRSNNTKQAQPKSNNKHFFVELGSSYENFQLPKFGMASTEVSGKQSSLVTANNTKNVFIPELKLGFNFNNHFLTSLFGPQASAYVDVSGFNSKSSTFQENFPDGYVWYIGDGPLGPGNITGNVNKLNLRNFNFNNKIKYRNIEI